MIVRESRRRTTIGIIASVCTLAAFKAHLDEGRQGIQEYLFIELSSSKMQKTFKILDHYRGLHY